MKIHFYSDCPVFSGSENMLTCLLNSEELSERHELSFSYRYTRAYAQGLRFRLASSARLLPLRLPSLHILYVFIDKIRNKYIRELLEFLLSAVELLLLRYLFMLYDFIRLYALFRRENPDILHINNGGYPGAYSCLAAVFAARMAGIQAIIFGVNNIAVPYNTLPRYLDKPIDRFIAKYVTLFITASGFAKLKLCEVLNLPENKVLNIPSTVIKRLPIEPKQNVMSRLSLNEGVVILGNVALLERRKGHRYLLKAFAMLKNKYEDFEKVKLLIAGWGKEERNLKVLAKDLGIEGNVLFLGAVKNIFDIMNVFDIFILSSIEYEDFPVAILEAMSLGKPIIGTRLAGIPEQVEHMKTGLIVDPGDAKALSEAILSLLQDKEKRVEMGLAGQKRFQDLFSYDKIIARYIDLYEDVGHNDR